MANRRNRDKVQVTFWVHQHVKREMGALGRRCGKSNSDIAKEGVDIVLETLRGGPGTGTVKGLKVSENQAPKGKEIQC
jgi:hypothetical protein